MAASTQARIILFLFEPASLLMEAHTETYGENLTPNL
jgi:hypothetical protein